MTPLFLKSMQGLVPSFMDAFRFATCCARALEPARPVALFAMSLCIFPNQSRLGFGCGLLPSWGIVSPFCDGVGRIELIFAHGCHLLSRIAEHVLYGLLVCGGSGCRLGLRNDPVLTVSCTVGLGVLYACFTCTGSPSRRITPCCMKVGLM